MLNLFKKIGNYLNRKDYDNYVSDIVEHANFDKINNVQPFDLESVLFVIPKMVKGSGGLTSCLRIAKILAKHNIDVYFTAYNCNNTLEQKNNANFNLEDNSAKFIELKNAQKRTFDYVIATSWQSVYYSKNIKGYKIYFVQDYEPYFYPVGELYFLSKKTYELGFHVISLGQWNSKKIFENSFDKNIKIDNISFPFEPSEYKYEKKDFSKISKTKELNLAVYIKRETKRMPSLILKMLEDLSYLMNSHGYKLNAFIFGLNKLEKISVGQNLGKISKKQLNELYKRCDFGMVASMTNISLVPLEMIASGLPVIEFKSGTFLDFFDENCAVLTDFNSTELFKQLYSLINNPSKINEICVKGNVKVSKLSWDETGEEFFNILKRNLNRGKNN